MTAPPDEEGLGQLVARLRAATWDLTPEEIADAVWLARWVTPGDTAGTAGSPAAGPDGTPGAEAAPGEHGAAPAGEPREPGEPHGGVDDSAATTPGGGPHRPPARTVRAERTGPVALHAEGARQAAEPRETETFPIRVPTAASLPGLLGLQRALRPLRGYRSLAAPTRGPLDENATADQAARTGVLQPLYRRGGRRAAAMQLLMDASPSMVVWERMLEELRQTCAQLGAFRDVRVRYLHRAEDGTPLVGTSAAPGAGRPRPADQFRDPTGRRLTLVLSDCVGPLWQEGRAQQLLHHWSLTSPLAVVQPLPPRLWPRTALPADAGLLVRDPASGGRLGFDPDGYGPDPAPGALPVPVLPPTQEALGSWARLLAGPGRTTVRGAAGWVLPGHPPAPRPAPAGAPAGAEELLRAFRASASPGALRLATHLAAVPLTLPVMQLVQRAMLPDTGPMELAEVLLGGLLWRLPEPEPGPAADPADGHWYEFADGVREMLLRSLDQGAAALVLKHCSEFVERHFGKGARNFSALAVAQLSGRADGGPAPDPAEPPGAAAPEPELFAEVPARVVRWYRPVPVESGPLAEADRLLRLWHAQGDPTLLHEARELAGPAAAAAPETAEGVRARLVLGGVLHALAGTEAVRHAPDAGTGLLEEAAVLLTTAAGHATPGGAAHTEAALELAAVHEALWRATGDAGRLARAEAVLTALPPGTAIRHLRLGRVLLAQAERETTAELLVPPPPEPNAGPAPRPGAGTRSEAGHGSARDAGADPVTEPRPPHGSDGGAGAGTGPSADLGTAFPFGPGSGGESGESAESGEEAVPAYGTGVLAGSFPGAPTHPGAAAGPDDSTGSDSTVRPDARTPTPSDREPASPAGRGGVTSPGGEPVSSAGGGSAASPGGEPIPSAGPGSVTPPDREPVASAGRGSATSPGGEPDDWPGSGSTARSDARTLTPSDREPASPAVRGSAASPGDEPVPSADRGSVTPPGGEPDDSPGSDSTARPDVRTLTPSDREPVSPAGRGGVTSPGGESVSSADLGSATPTGGEPVPSADRGSVTPPGGEPVSPADLGSATPPDREPVPPAGPGSVTSSGTGDAPRTEGAAGRQAASAPGTRTGARAAAELRTACALLESSGAPPGQRCAALLDLARALGLSRAPGVEVLGALDRAEATAGDDGLLLRCRTEQARARTALRDWAAADEAYAAAADLTGAYSPARCELLAEWGESLLGRARRDRTASSAGRAEAVLREAFAISTGPAAGRARLQLLLARALVLRFARQGFLPDLYESCHLLEQAARRAPDPTARAEAWLELGAARTTLHERSASAPLDDAAAAFTAALAEARRAAGDLPGSVLAARAAHRYGDVVERMGRPRAALTAYQEAAREWRELTARLAAVPWAEVRDTQERVARLSAPRAGGA